VDGDVDLIGWVGVGLGILYISLLQENSQNLKMAAIGRNM